MALKLDKAEVLDAGISPDSPEALMATCCKTGPAALRTEPEP